MSDIGKDASSVLSGGLAGAGSMEQAPSETPEALSIADREKLIQRMLRDALDEPSSVAANLQVNGGDLLEMSLVLKKSIMEAAKSSSNVAELKDLQSFIDTYVKVCRQADRVLRLKHDLAQPRRGHANWSHAKSRRTGE